jgi:hypothetical protein
MTFTKDDVKRTVWTFVQAGIGAALVVLAAQNQMPQDWTGAKQLGYAAGVAFLAAGVAAVKNLLTPTGSRLK